jgi:hypothetical protein
MISSVRLPKAAEITMRAQGASTPASCTVQRPCSSRLVSKVSDAAAASVRLASTVTSSRKG